MLPSKVLNLLSHRIIGCAIEVHKNLGPGLLESLYEEALCCELEWARIGFRRQHDVPVIYKAKKRLLASLKLDLLVAIEVVVEVKAVETVLPVHEAQLFSYLRLTQKQLGLLINFNVVTLKDGIRRKVNNFSAENPKHLINSASSASLR